MIQLFEAVRLLAQAEVEFVIVGGIALRTHGSAYITQDLDVCYSRSRTNLEKIVAALPPLKPRPRGFPDNLPFVWDLTTLQNGTNFTFSTTLCDIDFLGEVAGVGSYADVLENSVVFDMDGTEVRILSIEALIRAKETAGREKDAAGLQELYALKEAQSTDEK